MTDNFYIARLQSQYIIIVCYDARDDLAANIYARST